MDTHAYDRLCERVISNGVPKREAKRYANMLEKMAKEAKTDTAVLFYCFATKQISGASNGNEAWAIIRNNKVTTIMLRRDEQPKTIEALRVSKVVIL